MHLPLKGKIWLSVLGPLVVLATAMILVVGSQVEKRVREDVSTDLSTASKTMEDWVETRQRDLATIAFVVSRDPKFFAMLAVPPEERGQDYVQTLARLAHEFHRVAGRDLFDILDERGCLLARNAGSDPPGRDLSQEPGVHEALLGHSSAGINLDDGAPFLVSVVPVVVGGEVAGVLRLGEAVDMELARHLKTTTRSEVSFIADGKVTSSTLAAQGDRTELAGRIDRADKSPDVWGRFSSITMHGETYLTHLGRLDGDLTEGRFLYVLQRSLPAELLFLSSIRRTLAVIGILAGVAAAIAGLLAARGVTGPITGIVRAAQEMERGNYDHPVNVDTGDELEYLAGQFVKMRDSMRTYIARLEEVDRMKSTFITIASHELRTPVTALQGYAYILSEPGFTEGEVERAALFEDVRSCVDSLSRIVQQITDMSLLDRRDLMLDAAPSDIGALLKGVIEAHAESFRKRRVTPSVEIAPGLPPFAVDAERMQQALGNLVSNAIRFTPDGGRVHASARAAEGELRIEVKDTGIGIPPSEHVRIFERIYEGGSVNYHSSGTVEFGSSGIGLGLPIARGIVEAHGGRISVESAVGRGSVFTVHIPWTIAVRDAGSDSASRAENGSSQDSARGSSRAFAEV